MTDPDFDPDVTEEKIDQCRLNGDWKGVMRGLEVYTHIFDTGEDVDSTKQHPNISSVKAYYWVCMAEAIFETKLDFFNAIDCCNRSLEIEKHYLDAKIVMAKFLLEVGCSWISERSLRSKQRRRSRSIYVTTDNSELCNMKKLSMAIQGFPEESKRQFAQALQSIPQNQKRCFLAVLNAFSSAELISLCDDVLFNAKKFSSSAGGSDMFVFRWLLLTCVHLLKQVNLHDVTRSLGCEMLSQYRCWLMVDSCLARGVINERLGNIDESKADYRHILECGLPLLSDTQLLQSTIDASTAPSLGFIGSGNVPLSLQVLRVIVSTVIRLAMSECNSGSVATGLLAIAKFTQIQSPSLSDFVRLHMSSHSPPSPGLLLPGLGGLPLWVTSRTNDVVNRFTMGLCVEVVLLLINRDISAQQSSAAARRLRSELLGDGATATTPVTSFSPAAPTVAHNKVPQATVRTAQSKKSYQNPSHPPLPPSTVQSQSLSSIEAKGWGRGRADQRSYPAANSVGERYEEDPVAVEERRQTLSLVVAIAEWALKTGDSGSAISSEDGSIGMGKRTASTITSTESATKIQTEASFIELQSEIFSTFLEPEKRSLLSFLPVVRSDPSHLYSSSSPSLLGVLGALATHKQQQLAGRGHQSTGQVLAPLQAGISADINTDVDSLWLLALAFRDVGDYNAALNMLDQCCSEVLKLIGTDSSGSSVSSVGPRQRSPDSLAAAYSWLGVTSLPSAQPALPFIRRIEICLYEISDPFLALKTLHCVLQDLYPGVASTILGSVGSFGLAVMAAGSTAGIQGTIHSEERGGPFSADNDLWVRYKTSDIWDPIVAVREIDTTLVDLVQMLIYCHVCCANTAALGDHKKSLHMKIAVKTVRLLMRSWTGQTGEEKAPRVSRAGMGQSPREVSGEDIRGETRRGLVDFDSESKSREGIESSDVEGAGSAAAGVGAGGSQDKGSGRVTPSTLVQGLAGCSERTVLCYAVALAELGEVDAAMIVTKKSLAESHPNSAGLMHLLALLLATASDRPGALATATALCERAYLVACRSAASQQDSRDFSGNEAWGPYDSDFGRNFAIPSRWKAMGSQREIDITRVRSRSATGEDGGGDRYPVSTNRANALITLATLAMAVGDEEGALGSLESAVDEILQQEAFLTSDERVAAVAAAVTASNTPTQQYPVNSPTSSYPSSSSHSPSQTHRTHILHGLEMREEFYESASIRAAGILERKYAPPQHVKQVAELLIACAQLYRRVRLIDRAKQCLEHAWRALFLHRNARDVLELRGGGRLHSLPAGATERSSSPSSLPQPPSLSSSSSPALSSPLPPAPAPARLPQYAAQRIDSNVRQRGETEEGASSLVAPLSETRRIELLRRVPTLLGWRLCASEACGWDVPTYADLQAEILAMGATLLQFEMGDICVPVAVELLELALATFPMCVSALLSMAHIEMEKSRIIAQRISTSSISSMSQQRSSRRGDERSSRRGDVRTFASSSSSSSSRGSIYGRQSDDAMFADMMFGCKDSSEDDAQSPNRLSRPGWPTQSKAYQQSQPDPPAVPCAAQLHRLRRAHDFALTAVEAAELSATAWEVYGRALMAMAPADQAAAAFLKSVECGRFSSLRPFASALMDE